MTTVGRNDPCPCGSGLKYKRCCLLREHRHDSTRGRLRQAERAILDGVLADIQARADFAVVHAAWDEFCFAETDTLDEPLPLDDPVFVNTFLPWLMFEWIPSDTARRRVGKPLALDFVSRNMRGLDAMTVRFAAAACERPSSFYAVTAVVPGRSLSLQDVLTQAEYVVMDGSASVPSSTGSLLYGRVVPLDGVAIISGCGPLLIPPGERLGLLDLRYALTGKRKPMTEAMLYTYADDLRDAYFQIHERLRNPPMPQLANTDGEPLSMQTLHFFLDCTVKDAFEKLHPLAVGLTRDECLHEAKRDDAGALRSVRFSWLRPGNAKHASWENTILGTIRIDGDQLTVQVNSQRRADMVRAEVEQRLSGRVTYKTTLIENVAKMLEEGRSHPPTAKERRRREEGERLNALPEVQAHLARMGEEHWRNWLDEKIPALRDRTPRQAVKTAEGRERVEALLASFSSRSGAAKDPFAPDVPALRKALGLIS